MSCLDGGRQKGGRGTCVSKDLNNCWEVLQEKRAVRPTGKRGWYQRRKQWTGQHQRQPRQIAAMTSGRHLRLRDLFCRHVHLPCHSFQDPTVQRCRTNNSTLTQRELFTTTHTVTREHQWPPCTQPSLTHEYQWMSCKQPLTAHGGKRVLVNLLQTAFNDTLWQESTRGCLASKFQRHIVARWHQWISWKQPLTTQGGKRVPVVALQASFNDTLW